MVVTTAVDIATVDGEAQEGYVGASDCRISYVGRFTEGQEEVSMNAGVEFAFTVTVV